MKLKKIAAMALAMALTATVAVGATLAYLKDSTLTVTNTFTVGNVTIELVESPVDGNGKINGAASEGTKNEYKLIPGSTYDKDPVVTVKAGSEECYLFVKFEEKENAATYLDYVSTLTKDNGWTELEAGVWYRVVPADATNDQSWHLLAEDKITINATAVTEKTMADADKAELAWTAYAVQKANVKDAAAAWEIATATQANA